MTKKDYVLVTRSTHSDAWESEHDARQAMAGYCGGLRPAQRGDRVFDVLYSTVDHGYVVLVTLTSGATRWLAARARR